MSKEAMKMALEALETIAKVEHPSHKVTYRKPVNGHVVTIYPHKVASDAITALKQALEQPEPEPVAVVSGYYGGKCVVLPTDPARIFNSGTAFYTHPPKRKPLTDEQLESIWAEFGLAMQPTRKAIARAIEAAHGIKGEA